VTRTVAVLTVPLENPMPPSIAVNVNDPFVVVTFMSHSQT